MLLLDSGVWVAVGEPEERHHPSARALVREQSVPVGSLDLTLYEIANVVGARKGRVADAERLVRLVLRRCTEEPLAIDADVIGEALEVATEHRLSAYDATYVAVARRRGWTLVSTDVRDLVSKGLAVTPDAALYP
ncbi:MAG TPA: type II toxin-antitoxin system VapC family toxin [Solirubrobacterales bacterium]|nr:type II toxin-antitoxin system VapC family toxin [Solirubrobacterales bacterium]